MLQVSKFWLATGLLGFSVAAMAAGPSIQRGEEIVGARCFLCHGMEGESSSPVFPRLAGQHAAYMSKQLADFKSGKRKSDTMKGQVQELTPDDMKSLGMYFAGKMAQVHETEDTLLAGAGKFVFFRGNPTTGVPACSSCHGEKGHGTPAMPRLAGQHPAYIESQLTQFHSRERTNDNAVMQTVAAKLTPMEIKAVADFIGTMP